MLQKKLKSEFISNSQNMYYDLIEFLKKIYLDDIIRILPSVKIKIASSGKGTLAQNSL
jgi:hypothetical protein